MKGTRKCTIEVLFVWTLKFVALCTVADIELDPSFRETGYYGLIVFIKGILLFARSA